MSLDFLRDNTDIINKGAVKAKAPIDFTQWNCAGYKSSISCIGEAKRAGVTTKAKKMVKLYANNEKEVVDLVTNTLLAKPELTKDICRGLRRGLSAIQKELNNQGYIISMSRAYNAFRKHNNLLGKLLACVAKGIIVIDNKQSKVMKAYSNGTAGTKIRLISKKEALSPNYKAIGRFSGVKANQATIQRFRISAINELGHTLGIKNTNPFKIIASRYQVSEYYDNNDLETESAFGNLTSLTDEEIADCIECGAYSKSEVKAQLNATRIKNVSRILQERVAL